MDECVDAGLVKMDFLGLRTLTVIEKAIAAVRRTRGEDIDIYNIPMDDPIQPESSNLKARECARFCGICSPANSVTSSP